MNLNKIEGIDVVLYVNDEAITVPNVLVGQAESEQAVSLNDKAESGLCFTLGIPKADEHDWEDKAVEIFGKTYRTIGAEVRGIDKLMPLPWNRNIKAKRLVFNGACTIYERGTYTRHSFNNCYCYDSRGITTTKTGENISDELNVTIYSAFNFTDYKPRVGDIIIPFDSEFEFDTTSEQAVSESLKTFRKLFKEYASISSIQAETVGTMPDYIITAR